MYLLQHCLRYLKTEIVLHHWHLSCDRCLFQIEEETHKLMSTLAHSDRKHADERKRQEWILQKKREQKSKMAAVKVEEAKSTCPEDPNCAADE